MSSRAIFCGTPIDECTGSTVTLNAMWRPDGAKNNKSGKLHHDRAQAFKCYCRYLVSQGYTRLGSREFQSPQGPVLVLDKLSRFGGEFRKGKMGDKSKAGSRFVPIKGRGMMVEKVTPL